MRHSRLAGFFMAIGIKAVLDLLPGGRPASEQRGDRPRRHRAAPLGASAAAEPAAQPSRARLPLALLTVGAILMLVFESTPTRVIGVLALFAWVISGVFAIADPRWLAGAPELGQRPADDVSRTRQNG